MHVAITQHTKDNSVLYRWLFRIIFSLSLCSRPQMSKYKYYGINNCLQNSVHADKGKTLTEKDNIVRQKIMWK